MMSFGFDTNLCRMVADFLHNRTFKVKVGEALSDGKCVRAGVPQGSLLGPVLYNIFISDIPQPPDGDLLLIYADDILIASTGPRAAIVNARLNGYLRVLHEYFCKWGLNLNIGKTDCVIFKGRKGGLYPNSRKFVPVLEIGGGNVRVSDRMRYLGVIFSGKFEFIRHIDFILDRMKRVFHMYCGLLRRKEGLSREVKLLIYKQIIRPLMSYAFPVWFGISSHQMERLRVWERRIISACLGLKPRVAPDGSIRRPSCRLIYGRAGFERIDAFLMRTALTFMERSVSMPNGIVGNCFSAASDPTTVRTREYLSPVDIITLRDAGMLYRGADLLFYHRRARSLSLENLVYNTVQ